MFLDRRVGIDGRYAEGELLGIGKYIRILALRLARKGFKVTIFYSQKPKYKILGKNIYSVVLPSKNTYIWEQFLLPKALPKRKIILYHAAGNFGVPLFCPCPSILTVHDVIPLLKRGYFKNSRFGSFSKLSYYLRLAVSVFRANRIITDSEFTKKSLVKRLRVEPSRIKVVHLGVSIPRGRKLSKVIRGQYVLNNSGIDDRKNLPRVVKSFALVSREFPRLKLVITGENQLLREKLERLTQKLSISKKIVFTGYIRESVLWSLIRNASCLCIPSEIEGFGLPVLEGFAANVPVVTSRTSSIPEVSGKAAILVNPYSVKEISQGLRKVLVDKKLRKVLIESGFQQIKKFSWSKTVGETVKIYKEVLGSEGFFGCHCLKRRKDH